MANSNFSDSSRSTGVGDDREEVGNGVRQTPGGGRTYPYQCPIRCSIDEFLAKRLGHADICLQR